jgi:hypothetical protein
MGSHCIENRRERVLSNLRGGCIPVVPDSQGFVRTPAPLPIGADRISSPPMTEIVLDAIPPENRSCSMIALGINRPSGAGGACGAGSQGFARSRGLHPGLFSLLPTGGFAVDGRKLRDPQDCTDLSEPYVGSLPFLPEGGTENSPGCSAAEPWDFVRTRPPRPVGADRRHMTGIVFDAIHPENRSCSMIALGINRPSGAGGACGAGSLGFARLRGLHPGLFSPLPPGGGQRP